MSLYASYFQMTEIHYKTALKTDLFYVSIFIFTTKHVFVFSITILGH
jgi:hypothetical protein